MCLFRTFVGIFSAHTRSVRPQEEVGKQAQAAKAVDYASRRDRASSCRAS